jgi:hypothetical protein
MHPIHRAVDGAVGVVLSIDPTGSPLVGLALVALVTAVATLLLFRATSAQSRLLAVKRRIQAGVFEMRLFKDEPRVFLRVLAASARDQLGYLRLTLLPLLWILPPVVLLLVHLDARFGIAGLATGRLALLEIVMDQHAAASGRPSMTLEADEGIEVVGEPVWVPSQRELTWRLRTKQDGRFTVAVRHGAERVEKDVVAGSTHLVSKSPIRARRAGPATWLSTEAPLPSDGAIESITVGYERADLPVLGWRVHWLVAFLVLSLLFALVLRGPLGVTI